MTEDADGPFIQVAAICERVITEPDGAVTAVRIIDRIYFIAGPDGNPLNPTQPVWFLITLKAGAARGNFKVQLVRERPSGERDQVFETPVLLEGEDRGANLVIQTAFMPEQQGLHWFDVIFEGHRITRMPLRAVFQQMPQGSPGPL